MPRKSWLNRDHAAPRGKRRTASPRASRRRQPMSMAIPRPSLRSLGIAVLSLAWLGVYYWQPTASALAPQVATTLQRPLMTATPTAEGQDLLASYGKQWLDYQTQLGDNIYLIFRALSLPREALSALVAVEGADRPITRLHAKQQVRVLVDEAKSIEQLELYAEGELQHRFIRNADGFWRQDLRFAQRETLP